MKLIVFAASSSSTSINKKLATYAASLLDNASVEVLDLNDYELPLFSEDKEKSLEQPELAQDFLNKVGACDALIISFTEHNGSYSAAYKNLFDWCSRITGKVYQDKPMVILSTSPGARGGASVIAMALNSMPFFGGVVKGSFSLPSFHDNFDVENNAISNDVLRSQLQDEGGFKVQVQQC